MKPQHILFHFSFWTSLVGLTVGCGAEEVMIQEHSVEQATSDMNSLPLFPLTEFQQYGLRLTNIYVFFWRPSTSAQDIALLLSTLEERRAIDQEVKSLDLRQRRAQKAKKAKLKKGENIAAVEKDLSDMRREKEGLSARFRQMLDVLPRTVDWVNAAPREFFFSTEKDGSLSLTISGMDLAENGQPHNYSTPTEIQQLKYSPAGGTFSFFVRAPEEVRESATSYYFEFSRTTASSTSAAPAFSGKILVFKGNAVVRQGSISLQ